MKIHELDRRRYMAVIFYRSARNDTAERLQSIISAEIPLEESEVYESINGLSERLRKPSCDQCIAIILAVTETELSEILSIKELLMDVRTILILPDNSDKTVSTGHRLHPRYLSYKDSDFQDVAVVLNRMIRLMEQKVVYPDKCLNHIGREIH